MTYLMIQVSPKTISNKTGDPCAVILGLKLVLRGRVSKTALCLHFSNVNNECYINHHVQRRIILTLKEL